jgi:hypothetical protein
MYLYFLLNSRYPLPWIVIISKLDLFLNKARNSEIATVTLLLTLLSIPQPYANKNALLSVSPSYSLKAQRILNVGLDILSLVPLIDMACRSINTFVSM